MLAKNGQLALLALLATGTLLGCKHETQIDVSSEPIRPVKLYTLVDSSSKDIELFPAQVKATEEVTLSFRVPGELIKLPAQSGMLVHKGELLAQLDNRDYLTELQVRNSDYDLLLANFTRMKELRKKKLLSKADYDQSYAELKKAESALKLAKDKLADTELLAPFDGRIAYVDANNFQYIETQQAILTMQTIKSLDISIQVPERIMSQLSEQETNASYLPTVSLSHSDKLHPLTYKEHATQATPGTQAYEMIFTLQMPDDSQVVYPGMGATVHVDMNKLFLRDFDNTYIIPLTALQENDTDGKTYVWSYHDGVVKPILATKHSISSQGIVISGPLEPGQKLVSAGVYRLREGMKVKPLKRERGL
ncbi:efflux RND transporter periplasmic adaptor subunit [Vibrio splendidus]|uniref:efflux RND transporter periplasmic adaptor subunit n=1 Tax=Vibrio splendidus TaxID=29497 RepID=UPI0024697921|nr:efflux RND transporter periplasmic adaptor subunit [Vibrio splendidus]MDH5917610.1 efflux RND transporter periplasmic adaptor subunit [Vibrio splendidus]